MEFILVSKKKMSKIEMRENVLDQTQVEKHAIHENIRARLKTLKSWIIEISWI